MIQITMIHADDNNTDDNDTDEDDTDDEINRL